MSTHFLCSIYKIKITLFIGGSRGGSQGASEPPFCQIHVSLTTEFSIVLYWTFKKVLQHYNKALLKLVKVRLQLFHLHHYLFHAVFSALSLHSCKEPTNT